jgi:hypothetical protein
LSYRIFVSNLYSRNIYILTQAEFVANAATRHALNMVANIGMSNFRAVNPPNNDSANFPSTTPATTYDLGRQNIPNNVNDLLVNNANLSRLTNNIINRNFSYRICIWKYDKNINPNLMRVKVFIFYRNTLVRSYIFTIEQ